MIGHSETSARALYAAVYLLRRSISILEQPGFRSKDVSSSWTCSPGASSYRRSYSTATPDIAVAIPQGARRSIPLPYSPRTKKKVLQQEPRQDPIKAKANGERAESSSSSTSKDERRKSLKPSRSTSMPKASSSWQQQPISTRAFHKPSIAQAETNLKIQMDEATVDQDEVKAEIVETEAEIMDQAVRNEIFEKLVKEPPPHLSSIMDNMPAVRGLVIAQGSMNATDIVLTEVKPQREMKVNTLRSELRRIPFNPGVHMMQDPRTGVWNFEPDQLHDIPAVEDFAFHRLPQYVSPSGDKELKDLATKAGCQYTGSTSTLTKAFSQIYFALSGNRGVDLNTLSQAFSGERSDYTFGATLPASLIIGRQPDGTVYVDNDKIWDIDNILSDFGVILEKMLISEPDDFKRFLNSSPESVVPESERTEKEAYRYQKANKLLMRSQLDCYDPRLPGTGVFDIKTRACLPIRHDRANYKANSEYDIWKARGYSLSYEREYYDLIRSAFLKYSMQARIGMMDGIAVAYHNTKRIFGFEYLPLTELDERLFGSSEMADQAFRLCIAFFETLLDEILTCFPDQDVNVTIKQLAPASAQAVTVFVQPTKYEGTRPIQAFSLCFDNYLDGEQVMGPMTFSVNDEIRRKQEWTVKWSLQRTAMDANGQQNTAAAHRTAIKDLISVISLPTPEGSTIRETKDAQAENPSSSTLTETKWKSPDSRILELRREAKESGKAYEKRKATWSTVKTLSRDPPLSPSLSA